jgi:hypothetical protein
VWCTGLGLGPMRPARTGVRFPRLPHVILAQDPPDNTYMAIEVTARLQVADDLRNLPTVDLRRDALRSIREIQDHPFLSLPLENLPFIGDLSDCRKKYFGNTEYRVVYRLLPDEKRPTKADVISVGPRARFAVYVEALTRLGRKKRP